MHSEILGPTGKAASREPTIILGLQDFADLSDVLQAN